MKYKNGVFCFVMYVFLFQVVKNAFTLQEPKYISTHTFAKSLIIEGNMKINNLMGENFADWISFLKVTSSPEINTDLEFEYLNADNVNFLRRLNNIDIYFLLNDAVKKKDDQVNVALSFFLIILFIFAFFNSSKVT